MMWREQETKVNGRKYRCYCTRRGIEAFVYGEDEGGWGHWDAVFSERMGHLNDPPDNDETRQIVRDMEIAVIADAYGESPNIVRRLTGG